MRLSNCVALKILSFTILVVSAGACGGPPTASPPAEEPNRGGDFVGVDLAAPGGKPTGEVPERVWWKMDANVEALGLDAGQLAQIEDIDTRFFAELTQLRREERRAYARFLSAVRVNQPGGGQIERSSKAFSDCRARRQDLLIRRVTELRQVVTLEQWSQLKSVAPAVLQIGLFHPFASSEPLKITDEWPPDSDASGS